MQHSIMHCLQPVQRPCMLQAQYKYNWTQLTDNCWRCRPSQEVLDAIEDDFEGQEKVTSLESYLVFVNSLLSHTFHWLHAAVPVLCPLVLEAEEPLLLRSAASQTCTANRQCMWCMATGTSLRLSGGQCHRQSTVLASRLLCPECYCPHAAL